jgi:hypothetical protein
VFVAPAVRSEPRGEKHTACASRWLWVNVDRSGQLHALWAFLAERPCHLLIDSGGSGGAHAYFKLAEPLPADTRGEGDRRAGRANRPPSGAPKINATAQQRVLSVECEWRVSSVAVSVLTS